jgi:formylglycine-generating enzyme required for sulfatase activity
MKKILGRLFIFITLLLLALLLTSCNFPFFPTAQPAAEPVEEPLGTPTPECSVVRNVDYLPTIGSKLKWVDASDFVYVPEGEFVMGAASEEPEDFNPQHVVFLDNFWIQEAEVTNQQYARCVEAGVCVPPFEEDDEPYRFADAAFANYPVVGVDWFQAEDYCT